MTKIWQIKWAKLILYLMDEPKNKNLKIYTYNKWVHFWWAIFSAQYYFCNWTCRRRKSLAFIFAFIEEGWRQSFYFFSWDVEFWSNKRKWPKGARQGQWPEPAMTMSIIYVTKFFLQFLTQLTHSITLLVNKAYILSWHNPLHRPPPNDRDVI